MARFSVRGENFKKKKNLFFAVTFSLYVCALAYQNLCGYLFKKIKTGKKNKKKTNRFSDWQIYKKNKKTPEIAWKIPEKETTPFALPPNFLLFLNHNLMIPVRLCCLFCLVNLRNLNIWFEFFRADKVTIVTHSPNKKSFM